MISLDDRFYANLEQEENCVARPCGISGSLDPIGVPLKMQAMLPSISTSSLDEESGRFWAAESSVLASYDAQVKNKTYSITYEFSPDLRLQCTGLYGLHTIQRGAKTVEMVDREAYLLLFVSTASYPKRYEHVQLRLVLLRIYGTLDISMLKSKLRFGSVETVWFERSVCPRYDGIQSEPWP